MKLFYMRDSDGGSGAYVVSQNVRTAITKFEECFGYPPDVIKSMLDDYDIVLVDGHKEQA